MKTNRLYLSTPDPWITHEITVNLPLKKKIAKKAIRLALEKNSFLGIYAEIGSD